MRERQKLGGLTNSRSFFPAQGGGTEDQDTGRLTCGEGGALALACAVLAVPSHGRMELVCGLSLVKAWIPAVFS